MHDTIAVPFLCKSTLTVHFPTGRLCYSASLLIKLFPRYSSERLPGGPRY